MVNLDPIKEHQTNGINCDITTGDVLARLTEWDKQYGIEISNVGADRLMVKFKTLPEELTTLAEEIDEFCPDVIDQGYGCMDDIVEMMAASGQQLDEKNQALLQGVSFDDPDFGLQILENALRQDRAVSLWWD